jgi:glycosyltransferase involved in cell wall biosynthesis
MENNPLVSVLMTAYNREKFIADAINSVLRSSYTNFELIIVDDHSTDLTYKIALDFQKNDSRIKLYKNDINLGQFKNRNRAIELAQGELIKFLDSDDELTEIGLEIMVKSISSFPNAGIAVPVKESFKNNLPHELISHDSVHLHYQGENHLCYGPTAILFTKKALEQVGGFEEEYGILTDTLLNIKIASVFSTVLIEKDLFFWRRHDGQITEEQEDNVRMIKERYDIMKATMEYEKLPLTGKEIDNILNNFTKINFRHFLFYVGKGRIKDALQVKNDTDLTFKNIFNAIIKSFLN